jgi:hypothetical protein
MATRHSDQAMMWAYGFAAGVFLMVAALWFILAL